MDLVEEKVRACLKARLSQLQNDQVIDLSVNLHDYGLDSMSAVDLMLELEESFDVMFPDEMLSQETFETATTLIDAIKQIINN